MARRSPERGLDGAEAEILLCCARASLDPRSRARLASLVGARPDGGLLCARAEGKGWGPSVNRHFDEIAPELVPRDVMVELWGRYELTARGNRAMARALVAILGALDAAGVEALPYKGPVLAVFLYGDVALRSFCDLDILVRARDVPRAKQALRGLGYLPEYPLEPPVEAAFLRAASQYHLILAGPDEVMVELHWKTDADFPIERGDDDAWWARLARAGFEDRTVRAFAAHELVLVLCLHGSKHGWMRLAWLADVAEAMRRHPHLDWDWMLARAQGLGCMRRFALGLHLAHELLGAPLPSALPPRSAAAPGVARLAARIRGMLFARDAPPPGALQALRFHLSLYERASHRIAHVVNTVWEPSLVEWMRWPLPRAFFFLYPLLRLARLSVKYDFGTRVQERAAPAKSA